MPRLRSFIITLAAAALCAACVASGRAQSLPSLALPTPAATLPPGIRLDGSYFTAPILVDGATLFRIAVPANVGSDQMSVETRQDLIEAAIAQVLAPKDVRPNSGTFFDPQTLHVAATPVGEQSLVVATDASHPSPLPLLTVTGADAKYQRVPVPALAEQWAGKLQEALAVALEKRQPAELQRNAGALLRVAGILIALTLIAAIALRALRKRTKALHERVDDERNAANAAGTGASAEGPTQEHQRRFIGSKLRAAGPEMDLRVTSSLSAIIWWGLAILWIPAIVWGLALFPQTTPAAHYITHRLAEIAFVFVATAVLIRIADLTIARAARVYGERTRLRSGDERARELLRIPTLTSAATGVATLTIAFLGILAALSAIGIATTSVLTIGGIAALGITFAAQSTLRDVLNGFFVLIEDQFVVGDYVIVDKFSGSVENMTLRVVQLRDASGSLITIPHGQIAQVVNCSRNWSRVDYRIAIDSKGDVVKALDILGSQIRALAAEERWRAAVLDPVELIGVDAVSSVGVVLRVSIKTAPLRQFELKREINERIVQAFRDAGIGLGVDPKAMPSMSVNPGPTS